MREFRPLACASHADSHILLTNLKGTTLPSLPRRRWHVHLQLEVFAGGAVQNSSVPHVHLMRVFILECMPAAYSSHVFVFKLCHRHRRRLLIDLDRGPSRFHLLPSGGGGGGSGLPHPHSSLPSFLLRLLIGIPLRYNFVVFW